MLAVSLCEEQTAAVRMAAFAEVAALVAGTLLFHAPAFVAAAGDHRRARRDDNPTGMAMGPSPTPPKTYADPSAAMGVAKASGSGSWTDPGHDYDVVQGKLKQDRAWQIAAIILLVIVILGGIVGVYFCWRHHRKRRTPKEQQNDTQIFRNDYVNSRAQVTGHTEHGGDPGNETA